LWANRDRFAPRLFVGNRELLLRASTVVLTVNNNLVGWEDAGYLQFLPPERTITCEIEFSPGDRERFVKAYESAMIRNRHVEVRIVE